MGFYVRHLDKSTSQVSVDSFPLLLDELARADERHFVVAVVHESEWGLVVFDSGHVVFERFDSAGTPRHMGPLPRAEILELMNAVATTGTSARLEALPWRPGYP